MRILVAEDHPSAQNSISYILESLDYEYDLVENGSEAVAQIKSREYDLCFMNLEMPVMDGIRATKIIRHMNKYMPIIAITGHAPVYNEVDVRVGLRVFTQDPREECFNAGMNGFLEQPCNLECIHDAIIEHVPVWTRAKITKDVLLSMASSLILSRMIPKEVKFCR